MAASIALLTEGESTTDATSHATASVTLTAGRLYLISFTVGLTSPSAENGAPSSVTSTGATWVQVNTIANAAPTATRHHTSVYRTMVASNQTGAITMTHSGTVSNCAWRVVEYAGIDTGGTNGSAAVVQSKTATGTGTTRTATMDSTLTAGNGTFGAMAHNSTSNTPTAGTDFTAIGTGSNTNPGTPSIELFNEYDLIAGDNIVDASSASLSWTEVAVEIKVSPTILAAATADGTGDLTCVALRTRLAAATADGTGATGTVAAVRSTFGAAAASGTGDLQAAALKLFLAQATASGEGALTAVANIVRVAAALLTGTGALSATTLLSGSLTNTVLNPSGTAVPDVQVTVELKPSGSYSVGGLAVPRAYRDITDGSGVWSVSAVANSRLTGTTYYLVTQRFPDGTESTWKVTIDGTNNQKLGASV